MTDGEDVQAGRLTLRTGEARRGGAGQVSEVTRQIGWSVYASRGDAPVRKSRKNLQLQSNAFASSSDQCGTPRRLDVQCQCYHIEANVPLRPTVELGGDLLDGTASGSDAFLVVTS